MRSKLTKEIVFTIVTCAKMELIEKVPTAIPLPDERLLGNISKEKAQKLMNKYDKNVTVFDVTPITEIYEMDINLFIKTATLKEKSVENA